MPEKSSYPGGKSGSGIYQRLINLIPRHRILIVPFAGHCGVVRNIKPAEHTIIIDANPDVCKWWDIWRRSKRGRDLEIHNCDGIDWMRFSLGCTEYSAEPGCVAAGCVASRNGSSDLVGNSKYNGTAATQKSKSLTSDHDLSDGRPTLLPPAEYFIFCDPPYVLSERSSGRIYECELTDEDHQRFIGTVTTLNAARYRTMICGYACDLYSALDPWNSIDHRVPTRGGLQDERIWMNYVLPVELHDYRYLGNCRRSRERIRRRQENWRKQLELMNPQERQAMLESLNSVEFSK